MMELLAVVALFVIFFAGVLAIKGGQYPAPAKACC
jgi:hypothetical protein